MADLTSPKPVKIRRARTVSVPMLTGITLQEGANVNITAAGFATHATNTVGEKSIGTAIETKANPGASGAERIKVSVGEAEWRVLSTNFAAANLGVMTYVGADDQTFTLTPGNGVKTGRILEGTVGSPLVLIQRPVGFGPTGDVLDAAYGANELAHLLTLI